MYLRELIVRNSGPLEKIRICPQFHANGSPKPIILVGQNGSGKTTVMSIVADALIEIAATQFIDVAPQLGAGHKFLRMIGSVTTRQGRAFELHAAMFSDQKTARRVVAKSGQVDEDILAEYRATFPEFNQIPSGTSAKITSQPQVGAEEVFRGGAYAFFPANRSETPSWASESTEDSAGDFATPTTNLLQKPIVVDRALERMRAWLIDLLLDASTDSIRILEASDLEKLKIEAMSTLTAPLLPLRDLNAVLSTILDQQGVHIVRTGRFARSRKIMIAQNGNPIIPNIESLSAGQISLFSIFSTIIRYGDAGRFSAINNQIEGIVMVDEADAHLHPNLQFEGLPKLITMFPRVQFVLSSHSPLFPLGMREALGDDGFTLLQLPGGEMLDVERYDDFLSAFRSFQLTKTFENEIKSRSELNAKTLVLCEGQTDPEYLLKAAELLGYTKLVQGAEFDWVGSITDGQARGGGVGALDAAFRILRDNPNLPNRRVIILYDGDACRKDIDLGSLHVRSISPISLNSKVEGGIEARLPESVLEERFYSERTSVKGATHTTVRELRKRELCSHLCQLGDSSTFEGFRETLDMLTKVDQLGN